MKWFAGFNNFNLSKDIYDPAKFNSYPNVDLNNKPFACGELATSGSIEDPDNPTQSVTTCQYYNNYDISHHNEIWGSAFIGNFHSGFTWFTEVAHRYENSNPTPLAVGQFGGTARNINDPFDFYDVNLNPIFSGNIKTTYQNFTPFKDFIATTNINFNDSWIPHGFYDDINVTSQNAECYYLTNISESKAYGWIHNINHYWKNNYYYWADQTNFTPYYNLSGCNPSALSTGIVLEGLTPGSPYSVDFFYTRIGTPPLNFPQPTMLTADIDGKLIIDGSTLGTYLGCDESTADVAFSLARYPNRPGSTNEMDTMPLREGNNFTFTIFPNPSNGKVHVQVKSKNQTHLESLSIKVYDLSGRLLLQKQKLTNPSCLFDLTSLAKGCYFISISQDKHNQFSKIIIQ